MNRSFSSCCGGSRRRRELRVQLLLRNPGSSCRICERRGAAGWSQTLLFEQSVLPRLNSHEYSDARPAKPRTPFRVQDDSENAPVCVSVDLFRCPEMAVE
ncbi:hypothetical protein GN956_G5831 [Arapaima gigas]